MAIILAFHGTNQQFDQFSQDKAKITNDYYGGGVAYCTPNLSVSKIYAKTAVKKTGGKEIIYRVRLSFSKIFDVDKEYHGEDLKKLVGSNVEMFARGAGLFTLGSDKHLIMSNLRSGNMTLVGSQIFRGMSGGMVNTAKAREKLKSLGYDALRYNPVSHTDRIQHEVYIAYYARDIKIIGKIGNQHEH